MIIFPLLLKSQNNDRWCAGSIESLQGEVAALICFIETSDNPWTDIEKKESQNSVNVACNWLENQALRYGVSLVIEERNLNNVNSLVFEFVEEGKGSGKERVDWVYQVVKKIGYKNSKQAYRMLKKKYGCNQFFILVLTKESGVSYSMRYAKGYNTKKYYTEGSIIFKNYHQYAPTPDASISHEILHLCGAWDLYKTYAQKSDRQAKASILYPNDIMLRVDHNIESLNVDVLTAWLIGWNKNEEDVFEWFRPGDFKK